MTQINFSKVILLRPTRRGGHRPFSSHPERISPYTALEEWFPEVRDVKTAAVRVSEPEILGQPWENTLILALGLIMSLSRSTLAPLVWSFADEANM
jgi:hypothetical protein